MSVAREKLGGESGQAVGRRRRRWSEAQKRQIVAESYEPGVSVSIVARRYNVNANQVFTWRRPYREPARDAGAGRFVPVVVEATPEGEADASTPRPSSGDVVAAGDAAAGRIEIVLAGGRRVIVEPPGKERRSLRRARTGQLPGCAAGRPGHDPDWRGTRGRACGRTRRRNPRRSRRCRRRNGGSPGSPMSPQAPIWTPPGGKGRFGAPGEPGCSSISGLFVQAGACWP